MNINYLLTVIFVFEIFQNIKCEKCTGSTMGKGARDNALFNTEIECAITCSANELCSSYLYQNVAEFESLGEFYYDQIVHPTNTYVEL